MNLRVCDAQEILLLVGFYMFFFQNTWNFIRKIGEMVEKIKTGVDFF